MNPKTTLLLAGALVLTAGALVYLAKRIESAQRDAQPLTSLVATITGAA